MAYISQLRIRNFGPLEEFDYNPTRINIFVGRNNTGKTTILRAVDLAVHGNIEDDGYFPFSWNIRNIVRKGMKTAIIEANSEKTYVFESRATVREDMQELVNSKLGQALDRFFAKKIPAERKFDIYSLYLENFDFAMVVSKNNVSFYPYPKELPFDPKKYYESFLDIVGSTKITQRSKGQSKDQLHRMSLMEIIPFRLLPEVSQDDENNNVNYLTHYKKIQDLEFTQNEIELRRLEEYVKENHLVDKLDRLTPNNVVYSKSGGKGDKPDFEPIPYNMHGDGFLALLNTLHYLLKSEGGILLIEEPENHLHPAYLEVFVRTIFEYSRKLSVQVFMTSHSYDLIEEILDYPETDEDMQAVCITRLQRTDGTIRGYNYSVERGREVLNDLKLDLRGI